MLGFVALGEAPLGGLPNVTLRFVAADQAVPVPTQSATAVAVPISFASADQLVPAPTSVGDADLIGELSSSVVIPVPTQTATAYHPGGLRIKARRPHIPLIAAKRAA